MVSVLTRICRTNSYRRCFRIGSYCLVKTISCQQNLTFMACLHFKTSSSLNNDQLSERCFYRLFSKNNQIDLRGTKLSVPSLNFTHVSQVFHSIQNVKP